MKRETKLKIMTGVVVLGLATGYVASSPNNFYLGRELPEAHPVREAVAKAASYAYGDQVKVDDKFVKAYLLTLNSGVQDPDENLLGDFNPDSNMIYQNEVWQFYEWIPTLEEVKANFANVQTSSEEVETEVENEKQLVLTINQE